MGQIAQKNKYKVFISILVFNLLYFYLYINNINILHTNSNYNDLQKGAPCIVPA